MSISNDQPQRPIQQAHGHGAAGGGNRNSNVNSTSESSGQRTATDGQATGNQVGGGNTTQATMVNDLPLGDGIRRVDSTAFSRYQNDNVNGGE
ncbi:hypothetical protein PMIN01_08155 [Paraphaeosphaeria minitans]|uniref:Uncharacterized protein n=1 Tax=Paraphaeosphaeria minitans TaxID=565426 RepID=A0A9P6GDY2_9PLEO|nr:hypothetical protein PMIN01_08155 [Paraphaeosphaeria minitans]